MSHIQKTSVLIIWIFVNVETTELELAVFMFMHQVDQVPSSKDEY